MTDSTDSSSAHKDRLLQSADGSEVQRESRWRVGRSYGIHVYEVGPTSPNGDRPVATFHTVADARQAVEDHNRLADLVDSAKDALSEPILSAGKDDRST